MSSYSWVCRPTYLCELKDLLGSLLLSSPPFLRLLLADDGAGLRLLVYFALKFLHHCPQSLQLGTGGLSFCLQGLSQSCALSGLDTNKHTVTSSWHRRFRASEEHITGSNCLRPPPGLLSAAAASVWLPCPCWVLCTSPPSGPLSLVSAALSWQPYGARSIAWTPPPHVRACTHALPTTHALWPEATRRPALPPAEEGEFKFQYLNRTAQQFQRKNY